MSNLRIRLLALVLLGVGFAGGSYVLNAQSGDSSNESPEPADPSSDSSPHSPKTPAEKASDSDRAGAEGDEEQSERIPASNEALQLGAGRPSEPPQEHSTTLFESLTEGAMDFPNMKELDPSESAYDPRLEAQQAFAPMEDDLLSADPLGPEDWRQALETHKLRNAGVSKRAQYLRESGHPELAEDLIAEWGRVYGTWQARAYGRAGPPGYKSPQR